MQDLYYHKSTALSRIISNFFEKIIRVGKYLKIFFTIKCYEILRKPYHDRKRRDHAGELEGASGPPQIGSNAPKALLRKD
jgi:hypothetical protein